MITYFRTDYCRLRFTSLLDRETQMRRLLFHRMLASVCLCALLLPVPALAQQPSAQTKKFDLTVDNIMRGPDLVGYEPSRPYWSQDGQRVYFRWKRAGEPRLQEQDLYVVNRD